MDAILEFFQSVGDFFGSILDSIDYAFSGVWWLTSMIPKYAAQVVMLFSLCPAFIQVFLSASFCIILLFAIFKLI